MMSAARLGLNFGVSDWLRLGLSGGSLYTDLKGSDGLVGDGRFDYLLGLEAGGRF